MYPFKQDTSFAMLYYQVIQTWMNERQDALWLRSEQKQNKQISTKTCMLWKIRDYNNERRKSGTGDLVYIDPNYNQLLCENDMIIHQLLVL